MATNGLPFKDWALKEAAYYTDNLSALRGDVLGIDAEEYLAGLLIAQNREPLLPALGGLPFSLRQRVDDDLQRFRDAGVSVMFVFNGLDLACRDRGSIFKGAARAAETLESAWRIYDAGKGDEAVSAFGRACKLLRFFGVERGSIGAISDMWQALTAHTTSCEVCWLI